MTYVAASLYALGVVAGLCLIPRDVPAGRREYAVVICWPVAVVAAIALGLLEAVRREIRP